MKEKYTIETIKKITLEKDDILVVKTKNPLSEAAEERLRSELEAFLKRKGFDNLVFILENADLEVINKSLTYCPQCGSKLILQKNGWAFCDMCVAEIKNEQK